MNRYILIIFAIITLLLTQIVSSNPFDANVCQNPHFSQVQLSHCLDNYSRKLEKKLNSQYQTTLKQMIALKAMGSSAPLNPVSTLKKSKQVFLRFRQSACTWVEASYASGSGAGIAHAQCQIKLTQHYIELLKSNS